MEGVSVSSRPDTPAALTSIQKQVKEDLKGQGYREWGERGHHCSIEQYACV